MNSRPLDAIAIIGLAGRFPGSRDVDAFWRNLCAGVESIRRYSDDELREQGMDDLEPRASSFVSAGALLEDIDRFDAGLFGFTRREAEILDPQHRLFFECAFEAFETAGYDPARADCPIGVFAGTSLNTYLLHNILPNRDLLDAVGLYQVCIGNDKDSLTTHVAYKLNLRGPCVTVQTACSTSLVAVQLACQSLNAFQCDMALAGGVTVHVPHTGGYAFQEGGILSPDGRCRVFDAASRGTVSGNGVGVGVLKRLDDAIAAGDHIAAVIRGAAVNNDGSGKVGYTAPSLEGQADVIALAQALAGVTPDTIGFIEAHGTGTPLGDPIEVAALTKVFRASTPRRAFCALGSVKSNIGHLDAAAGVAGLIKAALAVQHGTIPPTVGFESPNPSLRLDESPFFVPSRAIAWPTDGRPRRAGVSSFGIGGTNAHVVIEEAPQTPAPPPGRALQLLPLSARTPDRLPYLAGRLSDHVAAHPAIDLADVAFTLQMGRREWPHRLAVVCGAQAEAVVALGAMAKSTSVSPTGRVVPDDVVFMFPGQGVQRPGMGAALYVSEELFRREVDDCSLFLHHCLGFDLRELLLASPDDRTAMQRLSETAIAQPALFVVELALAKLWISWGVQPAAMIGHSLGEYAAGCLAGVFERDDALTAVAARGRIMQRAPRGAMLAVRVSETDARQLAEDDVSLAAINGEASCVLSGGLAAIGRIEERLAKRGIASQRLNTSHAFHSSLMDPIMEAFAEAMSRIPLHAPRLPMVSNVTGEWLNGDRAVEPGYWVEQLRQPVRFAEGLATLVEGRARLPLEVGPGQSLSGFCARSTGAGARPAAIATWPDRSHETVASSAAPDDDLRSTLDALGKVWSIGIDIDWKAFNRPVPRRRVPLPTYPFERTRYWVDPPSAISRRGREAVRTSAPGPPANTRPRAPESGTAVDRWFYVPRWVAEPKPLDARTSVPAEQTIVFVDEREVGARFADFLRSAGADVSEVRRGAAFAAHGGRRFIVGDRRADYERLLNALAAGGGVPRTIFHFWGVAPSASRPDLDCDDVVERGFFSLLWLAQAVGSASLALTVVTDGLMAVTSGDGVQMPERAVTLGPCLVVSQELPNIRIRYVDLDPGTVDSSTWMPALAREPDCSDASGVAAYRQMRRWTRRFEQALLPPRSAVPATRLKPGGVYWITGGTGGIGQAIAAFLQRTLGAKLLLTSRTAHLSAGPRGDDVLVLRADATRVDDMRAAMTAALRAFGRIDGIIHAAGVPGGGVVSLKTREVARAVLAPKLDGARVLERIAAEVRPDFVLLCSSIASLQGGFGQIDYAAANAALDAFATYHTQSSGIPTFSVNWDMWIESGMAVAAVRRHPPVRSAPARGTGGVTCLTLSPTQDWVIGEHRVLGAATLPGTGFLELISSAYRAHRGPGVLLLEHVCLESPLALADGSFAAVEVAFDSVEDGLDRFTVSTSDGVHASGRVGIGEPRHETIDLAALRERFTRADRVDARAGADSVQPPGIVLGARWRSLGSLVVAGEESLARVELPDAYADDLSRVTMHPALLDVALSIAQPSEGFSLPFLYERVQVHAPLPARFWSHVRRRSSGGRTTTFDVTLVDDLGVVLLRMEGYTITRVDAAAESEPRNETLAVPVVGDFGEMRFVPVGRRAPASGEVTIAVRAAALNFRDVLKVLGVLPLTAGDLGDECAGVVVDVGPDVDDLRAGDEVVAVVPGAMSRFVTVSTRTVCRKPAGLPFDVAATLPVAFMTARHALMTLGRLKAGERVLIHAGAGGVGLAAVHLSRQAGAEVYATAGNAEKRGFLEALGVAVFDSRSLAFADQIRERTGGEGVDVVLNSLAGPAMPASLRLLRRYGRFLELGKRDMLEGATLELAPFDRGLSFIAANLERDHPDFPALLRGTIADVEAGVLQPLPRRVFGRDQAADAFAYMARARHIGKVVIDFGGGTVAPGLTNAHGVDAFCRVVAGSHPQVVVSTTDLAARIERQRDAVRVMADATQSWALPADGRGGLLSVRGEPGENVERQVARIWARVIGVSDVGLDDNFFELGGDSLAGVQVMSQINARFELSIPVARFFEAPTTRALAALIQALRTERPQASEALSESRERGARRRAAQQRRSSR